MILVGVLILLLRQVTGMSAKIWEHEGDYIIGASLIFCALYFLTREGEFLKEGPDGHVEAQPCACHGIRWGSPKQRGRTREPPHCRFPSPDARKRTKCAQHKLDKQWCGDCDSSYPFVDECGQSPDSSERDPLIPPPPAPFTPQRGREATDNAAAPADAAATAGGTDRSPVTGALLGLLQGACCPVALVGISFLGNVHGVPSTIAFLVTFICVSTIGTASVAAIWASFAGLGFGSHYLSPRVIFRCSCAFTFALGVCWVLGNYFGFLDRLDYTSSLHR
jgi:hypothetical protein